MPIRVLQVFSTLNNGGAENRMMDVFRNIDPQQIMFDFAVVHDGRHFFEEEVLNRESRVYHLPDPRNGLVKNFIAWRRLFKEHQFQAVHTHVSWYGGIVLLAAKMEGVPHRVAHARDSADPTMSFSRKIAREIGRILLAWTATDRIAISEAAAKNNFGPLCVKKEKYRFVPNSIDQAKYRSVDKGEREQLRAGLGIPEGIKAYVTVANFRKPKNHSFLLKIARALKDRDDRFILYLIGDGDLRGEIERQIQSLGLEENVQLMGGRNDVPQILCAFDGMIFPSLFEGLGGVVLEAQLVGVPAIVSTAIPREADVGINMVVFLPLQETPEKWAESIVQKVENFQWDRETAAHAFHQKGYDVENTIEQYLRAYGITGTRIEKVTAE